MMQPMLTVIIPTIGRLSLRSALDSVMRQDSDGLVELLVMHDDYQRDRSFFVGGDAHRITVRGHDAGHHCWGMCQRNAAMPLARGRYLAFLDDDDIWSADALPSILSAVAEHPDRPHVFRMRYADGRTLWQTPRIRLGNVGTPMIVVPNDPARLGRWGDEYCGDLFFARSTVSRYPNRERDVVWHEDVLALIEPTEAQDWTRYSQAAQVSA